LKEDWKQYRHCLPVKPQAAIPTKHKHSSAASKREIVFGRPYILAHLSITVRVTCYPDGRQWQYFNSSAYIFIFIYIYVYMYVYIYVFHLSPREHNVHNIFCERRLTAATEV